MSMQSIKLCNIWLLPLKEIDNTNTLLLPLKLIPLHCVLVFLWIGQAWKVKWDKCFVKKNATCFRFSFNMRFGVCNQEFTALKCNGSDCIQQNYAEKTNSKRCWKWNPWRSGSVCSLNFWPLNSLRVIVFYFMFQFPCQKMRNEKNLIELIYYSNGVMAWVENGKFILDMYNRNSVYFFLFAPNSVVFLFHKLLEFFFSIFDWRHEFFSSVDSSFQ